ncbi:hypothetical protein BHE74_00053355 [Ensete ventricosum]|nr:hypothetical protein BHE74_00053355 [Ensete ventricosum]
MPGKKSDRGISGACLLDGFRLRVLVGGVDLTCVRSAVRALAPPVYPVGYQRRVGHVGGPAVRGCDDLAARSAFVISFFPPPPREDLLEAPDEGVEDEVLHLTAVGRKSGDLAERVTSGANPKIWLRGLPRAQIRRFGREGDLGRKSGDLAEKVISGANPEIWPSGHLGRKSGDLAEKVISGANPEIWPRR